MRWNCPHCGVNLAVADEKMGPGWSFSRCYKCGGYALIRRAEVNLVKVDRAPAGEHVVLPEANEEPLAMLGTQAMKNLERLRTDAKTSASTRASAPSGAIAATAPAAASTAMPTAAAALPSPLVEKPPSRAIHRRILLPAATATAAILSVGSGAFLFIEGQTLWKSIWHGPSPLASAERVGRITDQVSHNAMAPVRDLPKAETPPAAPVPPPVAPQSTPAESPPQTAAQNSPTLMVKPKLKNVNLHSGPGTLYPVLGTVGPKNQFVVADWNDRWFKVFATEGSLLNSKAGQQNGQLSGPLSGQLSGWIRTDMVQVIPQQQARGGEGLPSFH